MDRAVILIMFWLYHFKGLITFFIFINSGLLFVNYFLFSLHFLQR